MDSYKEDIMALGILIGLWIGFFAGFLITFIWALSTVAQNKEKKLLRIGSYICSICPLCRFSRGKPDEALSGTFAAYREICPFCMSFKRLKKLEDEEHGSESTQL